MRSVLVTVSCPRFVFLRAGFHLSGEKTDLIMTSDCFLANAMPLSFFNPPLTSSFFFVELWASESDAVHLHKQDRILTTVITYSIPATHVFCIIDSLPYYLSSFSCSFFFVL